MSTIKECSYCGAEMETVALHLEDEEGNERDICVKCWIKAFDFIFKIMKETS